MNETQVSKSVFHHHKYINKHCLFALAWHWHLCWHWHSCRPSYRVGQRARLIRRRVPWGILRRVPWVLWSVVIRRLCWCWCTLCINWWLCCKYATKNLKQGSKIRSGLKKKRAVSYFTCTNCKYLPKQITQQEWMALCIQMSIHVPFNRKCTLSWLMDIKLMIIHFVVLAVAKLHVLHMIHTKWIVIPEWMTF